MPYTEITKEFMNQFHWNIDHLMNYLDIDYLIKLSNIDTKNLISYSNESLGEVFIRSLNIRYIFSFLKELLLFYHPILESFKQLLVNIINTNWTKEFTNLPILTNQFYDNLLNEDVFFRSQNTNSLSILNTPMYLDNKFFIGFLNSIFLALPFSCNQLICFYRFLINGPFYGLIGCLGWIFGQTLLYFCICFGLRPFIIPWFSLEPFNYFLAIYIISSFLYDTVMGKDIFYSMKTVDLDSKELGKIKRQEIEKIFATHFLLSWSEDIQLFHHLTNVTVGVESNILETFSATSFIQYFLVHSSYIIGLFFGCLIFSYLYALFFTDLSLRLFSIFDRNLYKDPKFFDKSKLQKLKREKKLDKKKIKIYNQKQYIKTFLDYIGFGLLSFIFGLLISSFSYYDFRYLISNPLGFVPNDNSLSNIFLNTNSSDPHPKVGFGSKQDIFNELDNTYLQFDIFKFDDKEYTNVLEFENLNYDGEYAWTSRLDKMGFKQIPTRSLKTRDLLKEYNQMYDFIIEDTNSISNSKINSDIEVKDITDNYIVENYLQNNKNFAFYNNSMDSNFKLDFIPFDKIFYLNKIEEQVEYELETEIKQKYYLNILYKTLLNIEIDTLISRQPIDTILSEPEENNLFEKRLALSNYYESNYYYSQINHFESFRNYFINSKTYLNNVYNQQFKGTLRIVERLFPVTIFDNKNQRSILKYDYPLFETSRKNNYFHEETILNKSDLNLFDNYKGFIGTNNSPFFIGWNDKLHQLVITNNLILKDLHSTQSYSNQNLMPLRNIQILNNLLPNSYSLLQSPSTKDFLMISGNKYYKNSNVYLLDEFDFNNMSQNYYVKLGILDKPVSGGLKFNKDINWLSFRSALKEDRIRLYEFKEKGGSENDRLNYDITYKQYKN